MNNLFKKTTLFIFGFMLLLGCQTVDFGDENINPNEPTTALTSALLTNSIRSISGIVAEVNSNLMVQYISEITYTEDSRYETYEWSYDRWYTSPIQNLQEIINLNQAEPEKYIGAGTTQNQIAVASLLKAYYFHYLTDRWGMIPFSEALMGEENIKPKFDTQEAIYNGLFALIDESLQSINTLGSIKGDILFNGDLNRWKQFGNTLKLIMAMRISDVDQALAKTKFSEAINAGVIKSNAENIFYPFLSEDTNDNPWQDRFETREDYAVSNVFVDYLVATSDPRISKYAELPASDSTGTYVGCPYGITNPNILQSNISFITKDIIYDGTNSGNMIYNYAQVCFSMAEAVHRGWTSGDAEQWYNKGIEASILQWNLSAEDYDNFIVQEGIAFEDSKAIEQIATQKWVALYLQGAEAWAEWRRLDFPKLSPAPDALTGNGIPVRNGYSALTRSLNAENYNQAVSIQGPDTQDTKLWWDVK